MNFIDKAKKNTLDAFDEILDHQIMRKQNKFYIEQEDTEEKGKGKEKDIEKKKKEDEKASGKEDDSDKDSLDKADDALSKTNLKEMDNDAKVELIDSVVDALQQSCETDDEFSEHMNKVLDIINGYKFEKEGEEEEKEEKKAKRKSKKEKKEGEEEKEEEEPEVEEMPEE